MAALFTRIVLLAFGFTMDESEALMQPVTLSVDKQGTSNLVRTEASAVSRSKLHRSSTESDGLGDIAFYILNLDRRKEDKFVPLEQVINSQAPWMIERTCRVSAPNGAAWDSDMDDSVITPKAWESALANTLSGQHIVGNILTKGAVALMVGHALMWEHIVRSGAAFGVVMEDDIQTIHPHAEEFLAKLRTDESLQEGWDFLLLQNSDHTLDVARVEDVDKPITVEFGQHLFNTAMYVIKAEAAQKILESMFPLGKDGKPVYQLDAGDGPLWGDLRGAYTNPAVADAAHHITDVQQALHRDQQQIPDCAALDPSSMVQPALLHPTGD